MGLSMLLLFSGLVVLALLSCDSWRLGDVATALHSVSTTVSTPLLTVLAAAAESDHGVVTVVAAVVLQMGHCWSCCDAELDVFRCLAPEKNGCVVVFGRRAGRVSLVREVDVARGSSAARAATPSGSVVGIDDVRWDRSPERGYDA